MTEYMIVGDVDGRECLIAVTCKECAEQSLARALEDPRNAGHNNIRIAVEEVREPWWRAPLLVN